MTEARRATDTFCHAVRVLDADRHGRVLARREDGAHEHDEPERVRRALAAFVAGTADFSDDFVVESPREAKAPPVVTLDERLARESDVELVR